MGQSRNDEFYMQQALEEAMESLKKGEVPVGAVIVEDGVILGRSHNESISWNDPTAHAEMIALTQAASSLGSWRLLDCVLYVTLEPCLMCAGAIVQARVPVVVWGAGDPKAGAVESLYNLFEDSRLNHQVEHVGHVLEQESSELLWSFFREE